MFCIQRYQLSHVELSQPIYQHLNKILSLQALEHDQTVASHANINMTRACFKFSCVCVCVCHELNERALF